MTAEANPRDLRLLVLAPTDTAMAQLNRNFQCDPSTGLRCTETNIPQIFRTVINWALGIAWRRSPEIVVLAS